MMMSRTCYYDTNDELFIIMIDDAWHDAKLLYEYDELFYMKWREHVVHIESSTNPN